MYKQLFLGASLLIIVGVAVTYGISQNRSEKSPSKVADQSAIATSSTNVNVRELTKADLENEQREIDAINEREDFPGYGEPQEPMLLGVYEGNVVEVTYWCNDACPDNGIYFLNYASSTESSCSQFGGVPVHKWGWGYQYLGCSPTQNEHAD